MKRKMAFLLPAFLIGLCLVVLFFPGETGSLYTFHLPQNASLLPAEASQTPKVIEASWSSPLGKSAPDCWATARRQFSKGEFLDQHRQRWSPHLALWALSPDEERRTPAALPAQFYEALAQAGFLIGDRTEMRDDDAARDTFLEIAGLDPENSAPLLYAAAIFHRQKDFAGVDRILAQLQSTYRFESYVLFYARHLYGSVRTPGDLVQANELWSTMPLPDYAVLTEFLKKEHLEKVGHQLVANALSEDRLIPDIDWLPLEYAVGRNLLQRIGQATDLPTSQQLMVEKNKHEAALTEDDFQLSENCEIESLEGAVRKLERHFQR